MSGKKKSGVSYKTARALALALPDVEEYTSYGTPAFRTRGRMMARLREDGETMVVKTGHGENEYLIASDPDVYFSTDHYAGYDVVLVRLDQIARGALAVRLEEAWQCCQKPGRAKWPVKRR